MQTSGNHREVPVSMNGELVTDGQGAFAEVLREIGLPEYWGQGVNPLELSRSLDKN